MSLSQLCIVIAELVCQCACYLELLAALTSEVKVLPKRFSSRWCRCGTLCRLFRYHYFFLGQKIYIYISQCPPCHRSILTL